MLTAERLRKVLHYNPETGVFTWVKPNKKKSGLIGTTAGNTDRLGYINITIDRIRYKAHRLAWMYFYGAFPDEFIDHINCKPSDNRIVNLRAATKSQNEANTRIRSTNTSGHKGVYLNKNKKWQAYITIQGRSVYLGSFDKKEEASKAYLSMASKIHGSFARSS
jgi:hypothetical protein